MTTTILAQDAPAVKEANEHAVEQILLHVNLAVEWHDQIDQLNPEAEARWYDLGALLRRARIVTRRLKREMNPLGITDAHDTEREVLNAAVIAAARQVHERYLDAAIAALDAHDAAAEGRSDG